MAMTPDAPNALAERREVWCVLRDGVRLHTVLLVPEGEGPWPALMTRHPYDVTRDESDGRVDVQRLVRAGYLVALQDVRGRYGSEGVFEPSAQEESDGADAVAWLAALPECTGVVGMFGASYASETQISALLGGAPALRSIAPAVTPVGSGVDGFRFRGGVPELGSMTAWSHFAIAPQEIDRIADPVVRAAERARWERTDAAIADGSAFRAGALERSADAEAIVAWMHDRLREPLDAPAHGVGKIGDRLDAIDVPVLLIGGWYDVFLGSTLDVHRRLSARSAAAGVAAPRLLVGPWSHDDMSGRLGGVDFGPAASDRDLGGIGDLTEAHIRWFDATLRGHGETPFAPVRVFVMGEDRWLDLDALPAEGSAERAWALGADGALIAADEGSADDAADGRAGTVELRSDPADPVPTLGGATLLFPPFAPGPVDQRPIETRDDVRSWRGEPLAADVTALGPVRAELHISSTAADADLVVRLCDEDPEGRTRLIADGIQRASARHVDPRTGAGPREPLEPGSVVRLDVDLWSTAHTFRAGHRIRVDIAPSSSPRWAVDATAPAVHTIHLDAEHPGRVVLTVLDAERRSPHTTEQKRYSA